MVLIEFRVHNPIYTASYLVPDVFIVVSNFQVLVEVKIAVLPLIVLFSIFGGIFKRNSNS